MMKKSVHELVEGNKLLFRGLGSNYVTLCLVDLETDEFEVIKTEGVLDDFHSKDKTWHGTMQELASVFVRSRHRSLFVEYTDPANVISLLNGKDTSSVVKFETKIDLNPWRSIQWFIAERDENGKAIRAFFAVTEVDEKEREEGQAIKDIIDTVDMAQMGIWRIALYDDEIPRMNASPKMMELLGLDPKKQYSEEKIYQAWHSRICPEALPSVEESVNQMISGKMDENTYCWSHPTLGVRHVRCGGVANRVPGRGYSLVGYHYDVTDTFNKEREQEEVVFALANTYECLFYIDIYNNHFTSYNNVLPTVSKYIPKKGNLAESFSSFLKYLCHEESVESLKKFVDMKTIDRRMQNTNMIKTEFRGMSIDCVELSFNACERDSNNKVTKLVMGVKDITAQREYEKDQMQKLKSSIEESKSKTVMLQNMTHELRTPLNAMFGFSQLLSLPDGSFSDTEKAEYFNYIYNSFNMLTMHIDDVLDMADAEHGNYRVQIGEVKVNDVCQSALQMAELRCPASVNMHFTTDLDDSYTIQSDSRRIQQVLVNYLTNACKHTTEGEIHLKVSSTETPGRLTFSVTDTGEGIPADQQADIFERYKKAKNNTAQGSGLGLNICSVIAEKLNAEVKLDTSYTNGARFLLII